MIFGRIILNNFTIQKKTDQLILVQSVDFINHLDESPVTFQTDNFWFYKGQFEK
jgi:hypothetical protein